MTDRPATLRELKESGYRSESVKQEMRRNLIGKLRREEPLFPGIVGYDETVLPEIQNAILSQHDMLFLGLRGQGKTRMLRMLVNLLDDALPIVAGSELHDDPLIPISRYARELLAEKGDDTPIEWIGRDQRYHEKLATPDVTIADLIGEVDLVKHAEGRHLANEDVMHFGLIPRSHRGIFCMNELPDLSPKIQVGLFNVLEERDIQIRGFTVRLPLDLCLVFSANPEDYTNRGRIVTPLKDRIGSVVRTHYPRSRDLGMRITQENAWTERESTVTVAVPNLVGQILEETSRLARTSPHVNQASGVSVRMSIANFENAMSNAERRGLLNGSTHETVRISDLIAAIPSSRGKVELNLTEEAGEEDGLLQRILSEAVKNVFDQWFKPKQFRSITEYFENGNRLELSDRIGAQETLDRLCEISGFKGMLKEAIAVVGRDSDTEDDIGFQATVGELLLDGLYCHNRCSRKLSAGSATYGS